MTKHLHFKPHRLATWLCLLLVAFQGACQPIQPPTDKMTVAEQLYQDPQGRFSAPIPTNWSTTEAEGFVLLHDPEAKINVYLLALEANDGDLRAAVAAAWAKVGPTFALAEIESLEPPATEGVEKSLVITYDTPKERIVQAVANLHQGIAYITLFDGDLMTVQRRSAQVNTIMSGFDILALKKTDLTDVAPLPINATITDELERFINQWMPKFKIPGSAVAIVQNGKVVYSKGFGVRNEQGDPITAQTYMMIGSTGKSLSTLMMATLVDDGKMAWDTPVVAIYPQFAVKDPALSQKITMRNLVCACTGVPRRDLELILNSSELSAEEIVASLRDFDFFTDFGETFQYSNQMVATGGYIAALAAGGEQDDLYAPYVAALQERVLDPVGMKRTTVSFEAVVADDDYATPHGLNYKNEYVPIALDLEKVLVPATPAGAHWSTLEDMSKYLIMQLNDGVTANGMRVVSAENLNETRKPQVKISDRASYGLGWMVTDYKGQPVIDHGGNTLGFTSEFQFLPKAQFGIIVLTNAQASNYFSGAVSERLLELVFQQEGEVEKSLDFTLTQIKESGAQLEKQMLPQLDVSSVTPYLSDYHNDALGQMSLTLIDGALYVDFGEFSSGLLAKNDNKGEFEGYMLTDPPLSGWLLLTLEEDEAKQPIIVMRAGVEEYTFARVK
jgi:CubicO group peptidase (beta-lactamase class C family)